MSFIGTRRDEARSCPTSVPITAKVAASALFRLRLPPGFNLTLPETGFCASPRCWPSFPISKSTLWAHPGAHLSRAGRFRQR